MKRIAPFLLLVLAWWTAPSPIVPPTSLATTVRPRGPHVHGRDVERWWEEVRLGGVDRSSEGFAVDGMGRFAGWAKGGILSLPTAIGRRLTVKLVRTGDILLMEGEGGEEMVLSFLPPGLNLVEGDMVVTWGGDEPEGLEVARVALRGGRMVGLLSSPLGGGRRLKLR